MNGITERCIPLAQGAKDPWQRVNYEFGLVLGVDEFVDEQCYFLEKEYQHNRALHGYGTVSGLRVTAADADADIEVRVAPGIGIDQYGRVFVVRDVQCASLPTWLKDQSVDDGALTIYVVARYDDCETELVPIAGQPCSSSEQLSAASRLRDVYEIDFVLAPPPQPRHDAASNLAAFLNLFRIQPGAPSLADFGSPGRLAIHIGPEFISQSAHEFREHIAMTLGDVVPVRPGEAEALLNDIFTYWITVLRPGLIPDLISPGAPANKDEEPPKAEIVLAQIELATTDADALALTDVTIDNSARPYLLHTHLIQELYRFADMPGGEATAAKPVREFATVEDLGGGSLSLWVHVSSDIKLSPDNLSLRRIDANGLPQPLKITIIEDPTRRGPMGRYFQLNTSRQAQLTNGDRLLLVFDADEIPITGAANLADFIINAPFTYTDFDSTRKRLFAFHIVEWAEGGVSQDEVIKIIRELMPEPTPPAPVVPFVTITPITDRDGQQVFLDNYELWFHFDGLVHQVDGGIPDNGALGLPGLEGQHNIFLFEEMPNGSMNMVKIEPKRVRDNVWLANPSLPQRTLPFARFAFPLDVEMDIHAYLPSAGAPDHFKSLREYMDATGQQFDGHVMRFKELNGMVDGEVLVVYVREQERATGVEE